MPFVVSRRLYEMRACVLPQTEVVGEVEKGGERRAGGEEEHFQSHLFRV
jgi:hypothetical protein